MITTFTMFRNFKLIRPLNTKRYISSNIILPKLSKKIIIPKLNTHINSKDDIQFHFDDALKINNSGFINTFGQPLKETEVHKLRYELDAEKININDVLSTLNCPMKCFEHVFLKPKKKYLLIEGIREETGKYDGFIGLPWSLGYLNIYTHFNLLKQQEFMNVSKFYKMPEIKEHLLMNKFRKKIEKKRLKSVLKKNDVATRNHLIRKYLFLPDIYDDYEIYLVSKY